MPYRPTERTEARKAAARERIVAEALELLAEGGYASAGIQAGAARPGVATGTVYRHFASKDELFTEVFRRAAARELAAVERSAAADGRSVAERVAGGGGGGGRRRAAPPPPAPGRSPRAPTRGGRSRWTPRSSPSASASGAAIATSSPARCARASTP